MSDTVDSTLQSRSSGKKSPEAFRTISEVADALNVPQHVLRFWESKFSQVKPMKRGGGRRYYRPEDVLLLRGIRNLLYHEGYTIRGVQKVLRDAGTKVVVNAGREAGSDGSADGVADETAQQSPDLFTPENTIESNTGGSSASTGLSTEQRDKLEGIMSRLNEMRAALNETD
ncbi:MAG TPA: MerR family transcriptional regulator [Sneathiellales bacterium]|nr:MerR family transcriptional regulator [Sneathiellales bacterium]